MPHEVQAEANQCITRVSDAVAADRARMAKVFVANLTYMGLTHGGAVGNLVTAMSGLISSDPDTSCGIVIMPNTGIMSTGIGPIAVRSAQRGVEAQVLDEGFHLEAREFNIIFAEDGMYSQTRPLTHPGLLVFSAERNEVMGVSGFRSRFAKSALGVQRIVKDVAVLQRAEFAKIPQPSRNGMGPDPKQSANAEFKQHVSGTSLYMKVLQKVWQGSGFGRGHHAVIVDLLPYDSTLPRAVIDYDESMGTGHPGMSCVSVLWAGNEQDNKPIGPFVVKEIRNHMLAMVQARKYKVPGFVETLKEPEVARKPRKHTPHPHMHTHGAPHTHTYTHHATHKCTLNTAHHTNDALDNQTESVLES